MNCPNCNLKNDADAKFCENCGNALQAEKPATLKIKTAKRPCSNCGTINRAGVRFCETCGNVLDAQKVVKVESKPAGQACSNCGMVNRAGIRFCETCGTPLGASQPASKFAPRSRAPQPPKPRKAGAGIAGVFVGGMIALVCFVLVFAFSLNNSSSSTNNSYDESYSEPQSNQNPSNPSNSSNPGNSGQENLSSQSESGNESLGDKVQLQVVNYDCPKQAEILILPMAGQLDKTYELCLIGYQVGESVHVTIEKWFPPLYGEPLTILEFDMVTQEGGTSAVTFFANSAVFEQGLYLFTAQGTTTGKTHSLETAFGVQIGSPRSSYNVDISHSLEVVEAFWEKTYPDVYPDKAYNLPIFYPEQLLCGESDLAGYCPADQSIIWHDNVLSLYHSYYGYPALLLTFAHEWGHHIQLITGQKSNNVIPKNMELGADCYAGATFNYAEEYYSQDFAQSDFYIALFYFNILGDKEYVDWETPRKDLNGDGKLDVPHGLMRERIGAFMDGYVDGAWACNY